MTKPIVHLHEETCHESLSDIKVIVFVCELSAGSFQVKPIHDTRQLLTNIICCF